MTNKSFWDRRDNIKSRPSVELRTLRVIDLAMEKYSIGIGEAIEKIMREQLWAPLLAELAENYPDISESA